MGFLDDLFEFDDNDLADFLFFCTMTDEDKQSEDEHEDEDEDENEW